MRRALPLSLLLLGCTPDPGESKTDTPTDTVPDSGDTDSADTDTGTESGADSETAIDTETGVDSDSATTDTDTGAETGTGDSEAPCVDTGPATSIVIDADIDDVATAKIIGEVVDGHGGNVEHLARTLGDVTGDGIDDLVLGSNAMQGVAVIPGPVTGDLLYADAVAELSWDIFHTWVISVSGAGDVDADGVGDLLVGAPYEIDGEACLFSGPLISAFTDADATARFFGPADDGYGGSHLGWSVSTAGDTDDDGHADILLGSPGTTDGGTVYLFHGPLAGEYDLDTDWDVRIVGASNEELGNSVAPMGDTDGDGLDDIVVAGDYHREPGAYVFTSPLSGEVAVADAVASFAASGNREEAWFADHPTGAGDLDADGYDDLLVDNSHYQGDVRTVGAVYVYHGPIAGTYSSSSADAVLVGEHDSEAAGGVFDATGDLDGDCRDDFVVGTNNWGIAYVVLGDPTGTTGLSDAAAVVLRNSDVASSSIGYAVAGGGDVDDDGIPDVLFADPEDDEGGSAYSGAAWVFSGASLR